jgi:DNA (cytosine-5)-methyltransferase 1
MKILNLYCGIGGNRKLWGTEHEITAVENVPEIAKIYQGFFPNDKVIITDAHQYLLEHFMEYDFIWSSPPCPTHSQIRFIATYEKGTDKIRQKPVFPNMKLYEEIIFLKHYYRGKWCVENVVSFYDPLIVPNEFGGHWFWTNFILRDFETGASREHYGQIEDLEKVKGITLPPNIKGKRLLLRNCVEPSLGKHILDLAINPINLQKSIF